MEFEGKVHVVNSEGCQILRELFVNCCQVDTLNIGETIYYVIILG